MKIQITKENNIDIDVITRSDILITDLQSALDFIASVGFETGCYHIIINKSSICEDFNNPKIKSKSQRA